MNRVELPHDKARFGPLRAAIDGRPELVRLVALVRAYADAEDRALSEAARLVLDRLVGLELFELQAGSDAQRVEMQQAFNIAYASGWPVAYYVGHVEPKENLRHGLAGALQAMRRHWAESPERDAECPKTGWDTDQCAGLAILRADAEALFPEVFGQVEAVQAPAVARPKRDPEPTVEQLAPQADFEVSKPWRPADVSRFGQVYALAKRSMKKPAALDALAAAGWARAGPTLGKRITQANKLSQSRVARQAA
ncbi:MAG: hypothetical protein J0L58_18580 [Burkholderiales bacterium]|nr:hypothetical protein [Burkholderiales bacterium]